VILEVYAADPTFGTPTGSALATTTTANGGYYFFYLPAGDYVLNVPATNFASGKPLSGLYSSGSTVGTRNGVDPDNDVDKDDNGYNAINPALTGVTTAAFTLTVGGEPTGEVDLNPNGTDILAADNSSNLTVDLGFFAGAPTAITLAYVRGWWLDGQVTVEWETVSELNTLGFDLYRLMGDGQRVLVNKDLVPALNAEKGGTYRVSEALGRPSAPVQYILVEHETTGRRIEYGPFNVLAAAPAQVTSVRMVSGAMVMEFTGEPGVDYVIETTDDLINGPWESAGRFRSDSSGKVLYHQSLTGSEPVRFYRALRP